ncbi:hypothetical protein ALC60_03535 [Trachymyrmex zeteki]|uniref:Uncharacterized protein n=1 Tax=Mycetomoellerius zeteki TaxID=64791 RepID=A0A151XB12_9HYME|nr:hypothetical protein ALC60_03535 [Trachymyrmex zeteki]
MAANQILSSFAGIQYGRHSVAVSCIKRKLCIYPSKDLQAAAIIMNEEFIKFHGDTFNSNCFIFDNLSTIVCKKVSFPKTVIACFIRTRTYICLRCINNSIKEKKLCKKNIKK